MEPLRASAHGEVKASAATYITITKSRYGRAPTAGRGERRGHDNMKAVTGERPRHLGGERRENTQGRHGRKPAATTRTLDCPFAAGVGGGDGSSKTRRRRPSLATNTVEYPYEHLRGPSACILEVYLRESR